MGINKKELIVGLMAFGLMVAVIMLVKKEKDLSLITRSGSGRDIFYKLGSRPFHQGAYGRITGKSLEDSCTLQPENMNYECQEGYYHVLRTKSLNKKFLNNEGKSSVVEVSPQGIADALAIGIALSILQKTPNDIVLKGNKQLINYVIDGWGFRENINNRLLNKKGEPCATFPGNKYCLFGVGRSLFFLDASPDQLKASGAEMKNGFRFAKAFSKNNISARHSMEDKMVAALFAPEGEREKLFHQCVMEKLSHVADCQI